MKRITGLDIQDMVRHWMASPVYGYLGSDYGNDLKAILMRPLGDSLADAQLRKLRDDILALQILPPGSVNVYAQHHAPDRVELVIEVAGHGIVFQADVA